MEKQTDHNKRHWQAHLNALNKSGLSRAQYCRQHKLSYRIMSYWFRKLSTPGNNGPSLVPVIIPPNVTQNIRPSSQANLKIILPGKMSVEVGNNFSAKTLTRLLATLDCQ